MNQELNSDQPHFMLKEIYQQPDVVRVCLEVYGDWELGTGDWELGVGEGGGGGGDGEGGGGGGDGEDGIQDSEFRIQNLGEPIQHPTSNIQNLLDGYPDLQQIHILACGTSRHAGLVGQYWLEQLAGIPTRVRSAAEFQLAPWPLSPNTLTIAVTQSGETADTLTALKFEQARRHSEAIAPSYWLGLTNQPESTLAQAIDPTLMTLAGPEVGVAATKTFTAQLVVFLCLALSLAQQRQSMSEESWVQIARNLHQIPLLMQQVLEQEKAIHHLAQQLAAIDHCIVLGQGVNRAIALEGALKLKETTYLQAEGYAAGEFMHGPIALLDAQVPVIAIAPHSPAVATLLSTVEKARGHGSMVIGLTTSDLADKTASLFDHQIILPAIDERLSPLLTVLPLQLLAYHIAVRRGLNVDRPRNITKTLT